MLTDLLANFKATPRSRNYELCHYFLDYYVSLKVIRFISLDIILLFFNDFIFLI